LYRPGLHGQIIAGAEKSEKQKELTESEPGLTRHTDGGQELALFGFVLGLFSQIAQFDMFS
jgi:hypothetical protein